MPTELPNLVYIEGPNSSGKSTLLNIIALSLLGAKSKRIDQMLMRKMNNLLDSDYQKLTFKVKISTNQENLILRSEKSNPDKIEIRLEESKDGKSFRPLSFETFESKYNLIYDIPNNPTVRLYELTLELKEEQLRYGNKFKSFGWFIRDTLTKIAQSRDAKRLGEVRIKLKEITQKRKKLESELPGLITFLDMLEKQAYANYYFYYQNECERLEEARSKIKKKSEDMAKTERKLDTSYRRLKVQIASLQGDLVSGFNKATPLIGVLLPKKEKPRFKIWKSVNPYEVSDPNSKRIRTETIHYLNLFGTELDKFQSDDSFKDAALVENIINSLERFENSQFTIPKIKLTIKELINILRLESEKNYVLIKRHENLNTIIGVLEDLKDNIETLLRKIDEIEEIRAKDATLTEERSESFYEEQSQLRGLNSDLNTAKTKRNAYLHKCLSKDIPKELLEQGSFKEFKEQLPQINELEPFLSLSERQTETKISDLESQINEKRKEIASLGVIIDQYAKEKERLEKQKPHKYEGYRTQLQDLLQKVESISQKLLNEYKNNVKRLMDRDIEKTEIEKDEPRKRYFQEVSKYLAHRIGNFRHIDESYKAKEVDLISGVIITEDDLAIHLADMGTGQSQSAYLLGLLNVKDDNRKIIALFDEIAMMDDSSLEPIYEKMKELYKAKRLLFGILVQKGNEIKTKSLVGV